MTKPTIALPVIVPSPELGELTDAERFIRTQLASNIVFFSKPGMQANLDDEFITEFLRIHRGEGNSRACYNADFLLACMRLRRLPEISGALVYPQFVTAALLFQRLAYAPRKPRQKWRYDTGVFMQERYDFGKLSVRFFSYLKTVLANEFPAKPHSHHKTDKDFLWDIALFYFGLPEDEFDAYWRRRLFEHQHVYGDEKRGALAFKAFSLNRFRRILQQIDSGVPFYRSEYFRDLFEIQAQENIRRKYESLAT